jgi:fatty acid-binding protein DegV
MKVQVISDSTAYLPNEIIDKYQSKRASLFFE